MHFHFDKVPNLVGFAAENTEIGKMVKTRVRGVLTSDDSDFYKYIEEFSNLFLNTQQLQIDGVYQFLVVIHQDLSADLYVNEFVVRTEVLLKTDKKKGDIVTLSEVIDVRKVKFEDIKIINTDKVIYCFKVGWRFGLFFDFSALEPTNSLKLISTERLDIQSMELSIGKLRRYLNFPDMYKVLETKPCFEEMKQDGWFPFVEIISNEYSKLSEAYKDRFDFESRIQAVVDSFNDDRIANISNKWWKNSIFLDKKALIQSGLKAYLTRDADGIINCIKSLAPEIEGILRHSLYSETGHGNKVKSHHLISYIGTKAKSKSSSDDSLLLPRYFQEYIRDIFFADFNLESGAIKISKNSLTHGVANAVQYTSSRAIQSILILDQIYYYLQS